MRSSAFPLAFEKLAPAPVTGSLDPDTEQGLNLEAEKKSRYPFYISAMLYYRYFYML